MEVRSTHLPRPPILVQAGALHYFRLPHPDLWSPLMERVRMAGYNAVALPCPWAYHSPAPGFYDFTGPRDLPRLLDAAQGAGLWLMVDAGPWTGLGLDAGGLPFWLLQRPDALPEPDDAALPSLFLRRLREWWGQLFHHLRDRENLFLVTVNAGPGPEPPWAPSLLDLARELLPGIPVARVVDGVAGKGARLLRLADARAVLEGVDELAVRRGGPLAVSVPGGEPLRWGGLSRLRLTMRLGHEHPRLVVGSLLGQGVTLVSVNPFATGCTWGYWGAPEVATAYGVGAPLGEGGELTPAYANARRLALTVETLGRALILGKEAHDLRATHPAYLYATRSWGEVTVAFLRAAGLPEGDTRLSLSAGQAAVTTPPIPVPEGALRVFPLRWPIAGGTLHYTTLEPLLRATVSGRELLLLRNEAGGELLLSSDFRPRHARGAASVDREEAGVVVRIEPGRIASVLLDGPEETLQLLALEPPLDARVWPLDAAWRTSPAPSPSWAPDPEDPARGLVIGPELVVPFADGEFACLTKEGGMGYRWGPWQGSDPHTWLAPFTWSAPPPVEVPELGPWETRAAAVEMAPAYDDRGWEVVPRHTSLAMEAHGIQSGCAWYRGRFAGPASSVALAFRHACDLFLNGQHIASLNVPPEDPERDPPVSTTIALPPRLVREEGNVLAALVESLGHRESFSEAALPHGLLSCALEGAGEVVWRVRGGLSGELQVQGFSGFADWALVPEGGDPHVTWHRTGFSLQFPSQVEASLFLMLERVPARAFIFLNGQLVGRYWEARGPQHRFWLPEGVLRTDGENELLVAQWTRGASPELGVVRLEVGTVRAWHRERNPRGWR